MSLDWGARQGTHTDPEENMRTPHRKAVAFMHRTRCRTVEKVDPVEISTVRVRVIVILLASSSCLFYLFVFFLSSRPVCHNVSGENVFLLTLRLQWWPVKLILGMNKQVMLPFLLTALINKLLNLIIYYIENPPIYFSYPTVRMNRTDIK